MQRKASAVWQGGLKDGKGSLSTDSGVLKQTQYSFSTRFENGVGTNPEELLAAAHAGCFTMALSAQLGNAGMTASKLETTATITLDKLPDGFAITKSHLDLVARVPGADKAKFDAAVKAAETGCLHRGVEFRFVGAGNTRDQIEMTFRDGETVREFVERNGGGGFELGCRHAGVAELRGKRH